MKKVLTIENLENNNSQVNYDAYQNHQVFELIDKMMDYYDGLSDTCFSFVPNGTLAACNYASYIYMSIRSTLDSIRILLKVGHITDAFVLIRKLFDTVLVDIYFDVVREDKYDWMKSLVVEDFQKWINGRQWIPHTDKIMSILKESKSTKELYPLFGWDTYLKTNREHLDNHVHASSYHSIMLNCQDVYIEKRELQLKNASIILNQIMMLHLSFIFYLNGHYMMAHDHLFYLEEGMTPPENSQYWMASYAQNAFNEFIKPHPKLATFIKEHCEMNLE